MTCVFAFTLSVLVVFAVPSVDCVAGEFKCNDGNCIDQSLVCNGNYDCYDGDDETNCRKLTLGSQINSLEFVVKHLISCMNLMPFAVNLFM